MPQRANTTYAGPPPAHPKAPSLQCGTPGPLRRHRHATQAGTLIGVNRTEHDSRLYVSQGRPRRACLPLGGLKCQGKETGMACPGHSSDKRLANACFVAVGLAPNKYTAWAWSPSPFRRAQKSEDDEIAEAVEFCSACRLDPRADRPARRTPSELCPCVRPSPFVPPSSIHSSVVAARRQGRVMRRSRGIGNVCSVRRETAQGQCSAPQNMSKCAKISPLPFLSSQ